MEKYNPQEIESKWAKRWIDEKTFIPDLDNAKNPYYSLFMFPYPSAEGLHIGNFYCFVSVDVMAKYKKLKGFDVFEPIGWDAFGIHSENYALKIGEMPSKMLERTIKNFRSQLEESGLSCDWTREVNTTSPEYYKWTQWIFVKLFEKGLAYQKESLVNWCPQCKTVLADEQIEANGVCERCKTTTQKRNMKQWFFKITDYAERLLSGLEKMDWSEITKSAQKNWIGRSEGALIKFSIDNLPHPAPAYRQAGSSRRERGSGGEGVIEVFTTRADTLFGCAYAVLSPEHSLVEKVTTPENKKAVQKYIQAALKKSELERKENKEKTGVFTGAYAINPINNEKVPIWIADYVLLGYGTGAIMAVPAHDERDWDFAKKYNLPVREVIISNEAEKNQNANIRNQDDNLKLKNKTEAFFDDGILINSGKYDGLTSEKARKEITKWLEGNKLGRKEINYKLRDWCISRQRYWGPPIPIIYCEKCGTVAVPPEDLPVELPELEKGWEPAGDGRGPLAKIKNFMETKCPKCGGLAKRESDVTDNFLDSAWYFFRYISPKDDKEIFDKELGKKWLPMDIYVGGNEHAVLHLMYTRFITMFLHDLDLIGFDNPFKRFRANGMILKDGKKMSKSKGNVVNPEEYGRKFGYDALKTYLLFLGPLSEDRSFSDSGIMGARHWAERIFNLYERADKDFRDDKKNVVKFNQTIKSVEDDMENQKYNTAIAKLMEMTNVLYGNQNISQDLFKKFLIIVSIFLPATSEELWEKAGHTKSIFLEKWPSYDPKLIKNEEVELVAQVNGKLRDRIRVSADISEEDAKKIIMASEKVKKHIDGKKIRKTIFVKGRLINIVI